MKVAIAQINSIIGDFDGNAAKILKTANAAKNAQLLVTPELSLFGYPPKDMLLYDSFIKKAWTVLKKLARDASNLPPILVGAAVKNKGKGKPLKNAAILLSEGKVKNIFYKSLLPTYDVFDEDRYFEPEENTQILNLFGEKIGISICEDLWNDCDFWEKPRYEYDPIERLAKEKVTLIINLSSSPFTIEKQQLRQSMIQNACKKYQVPIVYVNQAGANDDLIFDGASVVFNKKGTLVARAKAFEEDILTVDLGQKGVHPIISDYPLQIESVFKALSLGLGDYMRKCGFGGALVGLSGGIDSSVVACVAANALGKGNITGVLMPSPYTTLQSVLDAQKLAKNLGIKTISIEINQLMEDYDKSLKNAFEGLKPDITEENIQARIRGNLLMALSNKYKALVLSTGNKSELTVGYTTLYGDLAGGLSVIGDLFKTQVYKLAEWINRQKEVIPRTIIEKSPSAELRPNQKDQDSLPPYDVLDKILYLYIEKQIGPEQIIKKGFSKKQVTRVLTMVSAAEFKRRQAPPTLKVTSRAFGSGWRMPIAASTFF